MLMSLMANKDKPTRRGILPFKINFRFSLWTLSGNGEDIEKVALDPPAMRPVEKRRALGCLNQNRGYIFLFCVFFLFMQTGFYAGRIRHTVPTYLGSSDPDNQWQPQVTTIRPFLKDGRSKSSIEEHPIPKLMDAAEAQFRKKLAGQSTTLKAAVAEYKKRYKRSPPKGFDEWWSFAQKYGVKMVDEYDGLVEDLEPFWALSGEELRRRALQVSKLSAFRLNRY